MTVSTPAYRAVVFDLDGTLVQTERLKALSYAQAVVELCPASLEEQTVVEAFKEVVGLSRQEVATALVERFHLAGKAEGRLAEFGVSRPWQVLVQLRLRYYEEMLADPQVLRRHQWPQSMAVLRQVKGMGCRLGLATMSACRQAQRVLSVLGIAGTFDFVATRDDVSAGKPDPEIYCLVAGELGVEPAQCLVLEDSPAGIKAALAAGMHCLAVTTPFTREAVHAQHLLPDELVVDDPATLPAVVARLMR